MVDGKRLKMATLSFFGYAGTGIAYVFVAGLILTLLALAFELDGGLASITELSTAFVELDPLGIAIGLLVFIILGVLIWVFGIIGIAVRRSIGVKQDETVKFSKRPAILAFFMAGIVAVIIFAGLQAMLVGITQDPTVDLTNIMTLLEAVIGFEPVTIVGALVGLAIIGFLVIKIAGVEKGLGEKLPDPLKFGDSG